MHHRITRKTYFIEKSNNFCNQLLEMLPSKPDLFFLPGLLTRYSESVWGELIPVELCLDD